MCGVSIVNKQYLGHVYFRFRAWLGRPRVVRQEKLIALSDYDPCQNPIFILGVNRSGTSLLRRVLNTHSSISCPPETFYLQYFAAMLDDDEVKAGMEGLGYDADDFVPEIARWSSRYHEMYRLSSGKPRWADKTPQYCLIASQISRIWADAQYIIIFRHPFDILYSLNSRKWRMGEYHDDLLINNAMYIKICLESLIEFEREHRDYCHILRYEELTKNAEEILRDVFSFLGEKWEHGVMDYHLYEHGFGTEDPIVRGSTGFRENSGNWELMDVADRRAASEILSDVTRRLGYACE